MRIAGPGEETLPYSRHSGGLSRYEHRSGESVVERLGFAALIIALAIVANLTAYTIHKATYLKPDKVKTHAEASR